MTVSQNSLSTQTVILGHVLAAYQDAAETLGQQVCLRQRREVVPGQPQLGAGRDLVGVPLQLGQVV